MDKPWFKLDPNNIKDPWWLYSSIRDTKCHSILKQQNNIECYFIFLDTYLNKSHYRVSTWYKNDPNRYQTIKNFLDWNFNKSLYEMKEGDIVYEFHMKFRVYDCPFCEGLDRFYYKILERIEDLEDDIFII